MGGVQDDVSSLMLADGLNVKGINGKKLFLNNRGNDDLYLTK